MHRYTDILNWDSRVFERESCGVFFWGGGGGGVNCLVAVVSVFCFFLVMLWAGLLSVIVAFPGHNHILMGESSIFQKS